MCLMPNQLQGILLTGWRRGHDHTCPSLDPLVVRGQGRKSTKMKTSKSVFKIFGLVTYRNYCNSLQTMPEGKCVTKLDSLTCKLTSASLWASSVDKRLLCVHVHS